MRKIFFILIFIQATALTAQPTLDTIRDCLKQKPQPFVKFDGRNSFIENSRAKIFGIKGGISFGKRLNFGIGYNQLIPPTSAFDKTIYYFNSNGNIYPVMKRLRMYYVSASAEYAFYQTKHWQLSMPLQFGIGKSFYSFSINGINQETDKSINFIYEPAVSIEYKFFKWVGVGADAGYRFMFTNNKHFNTSFTSPTYAFKLLIYYSEIFKNLFPKSKLAQRM